MQLKILSITSKVEGTVACLSSLPSEILEHVLRFCDKDSLFKTRLTSTRLYDLSNKAVAERFQLDWKSSLASKMTTVEMICHHPLKYLANLNVHLSMSKLAIPWLKGHHINPSTIPSLLKLYPDGNMSLPTNMLIISNNVFGVLDNGEVIAWHRKGDIYEPVVFSCVEKVTQIYENGYDHVYAIRSRDSIALISSENEINNFFMSQLSGREIQFLYNREGVIFSKLDDNKLLLIASSSHDKGVPERLINRRIQTVCIVNNQGYLAILEDGELVHWGKGFDNWDFSDLEDKKVLSITPNPYHNSVTLVLEGGCTVLQIGYLSDIIEKPSKNFLQLRERVKRIYSTIYTHLALLESGGIAVWGKMYGGEDPVVPKDTAIRSIHHTSDAFAILLEDGGLLVFGNPNWGGRKPDSLKNRTVKEVFSTNLSFLALLDDHTMISWGKGLPIPSRLGGCHVQTIFSNNNSYMAVLEDHSLCFWDSLGWGLMLDHEVGRVIIPDGRLVKNVIPINGVFIVQLDNDELLLPRTYCEINYQRLMNKQYRLPLPEGRRLAVIDREM